MKILTCIGKVHPFMRKNLHYGIIKKGMTATLIVVNFIILTSLHSQNISSKEEKEVIEIKNRQKMNEPLYCERIPIGEEQDYKPCIAKLPNGELLLVGFQTEGGVSKEYIFLYRSKDGGKTWSSRERLDLIGREPYLSVISDGTIFITTHVLPKARGNTEGYVYSYLYRSTNQGKTWHATKISYKDLPEAEEKTTTVTSRNVLELKDGTLVFGVGAPYRHEYLWQSNDNGISWNKKIPSQFHGIDVSKKVDFPIFGESVLWQAKNNDILAICRIDSKIFPQIPGTDIPNEKIDHYNRMVLYRSKDGGRNWMLEELGSYYGEMYPSLLKLQDGRMLLTFTLRAAVEPQTPPLGVRAVLGTETKNGFAFDFKHDRVMLDTKTPVGEMSGGGFGPTVQLEDGRLVTSYSYRVTEGQKTKLKMEVVRWRFPKTTTVLFTDDANYTLYLPEYPATRTQINNYISRFKGKIDFLAWDLIVQGVCWYQSKVGPNIMEGRNMYPDLPVKLVAENIKALASEGSNIPLAIAEECHKNDIKMLASIRMGLFLGGEGVFYNKHMTNDFYNRTIYNLDYSLESKNARITRSGKVLDFTFPEVQNLILNPAEELAQSFPIDGFHINFIRASVPFESHEAEQKAPIMTEFLKKLRSMLDMSAKRQHKEKLFLAVRVPNDVDFCKKIGLDVQAWIDQGLVDIIIPDQVHTMILDARIDKFTKMCEGTDILVLPSLHPQAYGLGNEQKESAEVFRAGLDNWYRQGADGFSTFNYDYFHPLYGYTLDWFAEFSQPDLVAVGERIFPVMTHTVPQNDLYLSQFATIEFRKHEIGVRKTMDFPRIIALQEGTTRATLKFKINNWSWDDELAIDIDGKRMENVESHYAVLPQFKVIAGSQEDVPQFINRKEIFDWEWNTYDFTVSLDLSSDSPSEIGFTLLKRPDISKKLIIKNVQVILESK